MKATCSRKRSVSIRGFTLIELLMVIVIIALLVGLLIPAIGGAVRKAREGACQSELQNLAQTLASWQSRYGDLPPSRVLLVEDGNYGPYLTVTSATLATPTAVDLSTGQLAARSLGALRRFFPRMRVSTNPTGGPVYTQGSGNWPDFNGNGVLDPPYVAQGDECLVLFLGGQPSRVASGSGAPVWAANGLGRNPLNPFPPPGSVSANNRSTPMYSFDGGRLADLDGDGLPSYYDSLSTARPIAYFSAYGGAGYDPNDVNYDSGSPLAEPDESGTTAAIGSKFAVTYPLAAGGNVASSPAPNPYTTGLPVPVTGSASWLDAQTYQLVSAGYDGEYGPGGQYLPGASLPLPLDAADTVPAVSLLASPPDPNLGIRTRERDNLTSFHQGRLD